jgi:hypothetical protein
MLPLYMSAPPEPSIAMQKDDETHETEESPSDASTRLASLQVLPL